MDPFDLFEMFFTGGNPQNRRRPQRRENNHNHNNENQGNNVRVNKFAFLFQLLPIILLVLFSILPYLFNSVIRLFIIKFIETLLSIFSG